MEKRLWQLEIIVAKEADGTWHISCESLPTFHVIGETEEDVYSNAKSILTQFLELNYPVKVYTIEFGDRVGTMEPDLPPVFMCAEVQQTSGAGIRN